jgi:chemotaxis protein MotD
MIEQFTPGMPQVSQPASGARRDRQSPGEQDDQSDRFEDLVSKAGERHSQSSNKNRDGDDVSDKDNVKLARPVEVLPKAAFELSAALKGFANPSQATPAQVSSTQANSVQVNSAHAKLAGFKDALKATDKGEQTERQAEVALAKLVDKIKQAAQVEKPDANEVQVDDQQPLTSSDELSLLLGLTRDVDAKPGKKAASADAIDKSDKTADDDDNADALAKTIDAHNGDPMLMTVDRRRGGDDTASDNSSSRGDVVRVGSANGRGRSLDIDVPALPGAQQQDGAKSAAAPKIETATVLEARRYLGFSTETNGTALAAAIKSDPAWTGALQSAQRSDLGALANTVTEVNTLKLEMNPENLGHMVASLKLKGEELTVELRVNSVEAYRHLSADHDDIVKALQDQGFTIDKVTVQLNATDRTDTGADRDMARQGQPQRDGQTQREGQGDQRNDGQHNDGQREQPRWTTSGDVADGAAGDGRADPGRSGNLYL